MSGAAQSGVGSPRRIPVETHGFRILLAALFLQFLALGVTPRYDSVGRVAFSLLSSATFLSMLYSMSGRSRVFWGGLLLMAPAFLGLWHERPEIPEWTLPLGLASATLFYALSIRELGRVIFRSERITLDTLAGAICVYLLLTLAFGSAYWLIEELAPGSLHFSNVVPGAHHIAAFDYFSLVAITTLGYGDVVPVGDLARSLVSVQTVAGILYPSIVVARLIALHAAGGSHPPVEPDVSWRQKHFRNLVLLQLTLLLLVVPWIGDDPVGTEIPLLQTGLLLGVLYTVSAQRLVLGSGTALVAIALAAMFWPGPWEEGLRAAGTMLELLLYAAGLALMLLGLIRTEQVHRDTLYGAISVYFLMGFAGAAAFSFLEQLSPGSLHFPEGDATPAGLVYFSFMTLTTTGFGDIVPLTSEAHLLASSMATAGIFFPAMLVARLVSLYEAR